MNESPRASIASEPTAPAVRDLQAAILIIGSLLWDKETPRPSWRHRLDLERVQYVRVPIRYARRARSRGCTFTMTFAESVQQGTAVVVPCKRSVCTMAALLEEAQALWGAETKHDKNRAIGANWGCVGIALRDPRSELCREWTKYFQGQGITPIDPVNDDG